MKNPSEARPDPQRKPLQAEAWDIEHAAQAVPMGAALRPSGGILIDGKQVADTLQCVHCFHTWVPIVGSGKIRGWCRRCQGPTCGPGCPVGLACLHKERLLELMERGAG